MIFGTFVTSSKYTQIFLQSMEFFVIPSEDRDRDRDRGLQPTRLAHVFLSVFPLVFLSLFV